MRSTAFLLLFVGLAIGSIAACGARSELDVPEASGRTGGAIPEGGGGAGGIGGGGMGGVGGVGGMPPECEPGALLVYLVSSSNVLYSYNPASGAVEVKGTLACDTTGPTPFSMGVDRTGTAFVLYNDGNLYRASTSDASCKPTDFTVGQFGFFNFGMGFARNTETDSDELFVTDIKFGQGSSLGLARIDTETLELFPISAYDSTLGDHMEMTSSSDGNLYGYSLDASGGGWVLEIDKTNADILKATFLPVGNQSSALAFAFWSDDFYIFTSTGGVTEVTRYRPADDTVTVVKQIGDVIVGAGVSTCDPTEAGG
jgi:hypothetical protein